jgi:hypothetical protein
LGFHPSADLACVPLVLIRPFQRRRYGLKLLVGVDFFRARVKSDLPLRWLLIGRRVGEAPAITPIGWLASSGALAANLVVGHGLAQMAEYMLRPGEVLALGKIALARARTGLGLLRSTRPHRFTLGSDPKANLKVLTAFLERNP